MNIIAYGVVSAIFFLMIGYLVERYCFDPASIKRRREARARIDPNARCPYCGHRRGGILWGEVSKKILHQCAVCHGQWAENPVVDVEAWERIKPAVEVRPPAPQGGSGVPKEAA